MVGQPGPVVATRWVANAYGDINNLLKQTYLLAPPPPNYVRINVRAIGLNFADVFSILGLYTLAGPPPLVPGFELSGVVQAVGSNVTSCRVGDRVMALSRFGAYTTVVNVPHHHVRPIPAQWTFAQAAVWPCQALTAWYSLCVLGGVNKGACRFLTTPHKRVLVHSAAGGVGLILVELARYIGVDLIATVGNPDKLPLLHQRGVPPDRIIVRGVDDVHGFEKAVRQRLPDHHHGVDVVIDPVMGHYYNEGWRLLNQGGRYIVMGSASLIPTGSMRVRNIASMLAHACRFLRKPTLDFTAAMSATRSVSSFNLGALFDSSDLFQTGFDELEHMDMCPPIVSRTFSFHDMPEALRVFQAGHTVGKLVVLVDINHHGR